MEDQKDSQLWLQSERPTFWNLLSEKAKRRLAPGIIEFMKEDGEAKTKIGKHHLGIAEESLLQLIRCCGPSPISHAYRRDLSGTSTAKQLSEILCEISRSSELRKLSPKIRLRSPSGKGTFCDVFFKLAGFDVFGEAKRYEDNWPTEEAEHMKRSILKAKAGESTHGSARPRYMDLSSKLYSLPNQFPEGTLNILFLFHPSTAGEAVRYIRQALFGDHAFSDVGNPDLHEDGLFAIQEWRSISGCCFSRIDPVNGSLNCIAVWKNPRATVLVPTQVNKALSSLKPEWDKRYERQLIDLMS